MYNFSNSIQSKIAQRTYFIVVHKYTTVNSNIVSKRFELRSFFLCCGAAIKRLRVLSVQIVNPFNTAMKEALYYLSLLDTKMT